MNLRRALEHRLALLMLLGSAVVSAVDAQHRSPVARVRREGFITAEDGARLYYHIVGSGQPVVIVPAAIFLERDLARLAHGRTLVLYDMRGRGRSESITDSARVSIGHDVADLEAVRKHVRSDRFVLLGWSYLGMIAMRYAVDHPEHVERIILIGPVGRAFGTRYPDSLVAHDPIPVTDSSAYVELLQLRSRGEAARDAKADWEREYRVLRGRLVGDQRLARRVPNLCASPNEWPLHLGQHQRWIFTSFARSEGPSWDVFAALSMPVLIIHGTQDRNAPYGGGREWAAHLSNGRLLSVHGAAHMPWLDAPKIVYPALEQFLSGEWPPTAVQPTRTIP